MATTVFLLRILHIVLGILWVGPVVFIALFLEPTFRTLGPDAGKVIGELTRRRFSAYLLLFAIITVLSGIALFALAVRSWGTDWMKTGSSTVFQLGATFAIVALAIGGMWVRPAAERLGAPGGAQLPEAPALRNRLKVGGRIVSVLLVLAATCMAVARYVP